MPCIGVGLNPSQVPSQRYWMSDQSRPSVIEGMPADAISLNLVLENEEPDCGGELLALPVAFTKPLQLRPVRCAGRLGSANCIGGRPEVVSGHMRNRGCLARREGGKLGGPPQISCRGIRGKRCAAGVLHMHFAPNPGATCVDRLPRPRVVP